ncbi:hypothetical protein DOTSEDRAFT_29803 [Dothistroma septosporum NZE10]|uniref:PHD-type domain-containing protein n=1 Tax=Dothistroma septosporum (strain NZE10 / CBS 128990) TaxID=675120 RepID=N1PXT0_DOTSN|nr:hypothetical protein DOTSEDRAFT_29803 [Dothistroma septosporum NZE10]
MATAAIHRGRILRRSARNRSPVPAPAQDSTDSQSSSPGVQGYPPPLRRSNRLKSMVDTAIAEDKKKNDAPPAECSRAKMTAKRKESKDYCWCKGKKRVEDDRMALCSNLDCKKEWFHLKCVKLEKEPEGVWLCPECAILPACWTRVRGISRLRGRVRE